MFRGMGIFANRLYGLFTSAIVAAIMFVGPAAEGAGLQIKAFKANLSKIEGQRVLMVSGTVANGSSESLVLPAMELRINSQDALIGSSTQSLPATELKPGETLGFSFDIAHPPPASAFVTAFFAGDTMSDILNGAAFMNEPIVYDYTPAIIPPRVDPRFPPTDPEYPVTSQRLGEQGAVVVRLKVGTNGRVEQAEVEESSGSERLDKAAMTEAKRAWRYVPATEDGIPVAAWTVRKVTFELSVVKEGH